MKDRTKPQIVDAYQWLKPGDGSEIISFHDVWGQDNSIPCPVCGERLTRHGYTQGNWVVTESNGNKTVLTDVAFKERFEKVEVING